MSPVQHIFDTGTRSSLFREECQDIDLLQVIRAVSKPLLRSATSQKVSVIGILLLHVSIEGARIRVVLGGVRELAVPILLETTFLDTFVKGTFPP